MTFIERVFALETLAIAQLSVFGLVLLLLLYVVGAIKKTVGFKIIAGVFVIALIYGLVTDPDVVFEMGGDVAEWLAGLWDRATTEETASETDLSGW